MGAVALRKVVLPTTPPHPAARREIPLQAPVKRAALKH